MASEPPSPGWPEEEILDVIPASAETGIRPAEGDFLDVVPVTVVGSDQPLSLPLCPPPQPQPGFWFGAVASFAMFVVCQVIIPLGVAVVYIVFTAIAAPEARKVLEGINTPEGMKEFQSETSMLLLVSAHVPMIVFSVLALRLVAGRNWRREVAIRFPSFTHLGLIVLGFPALPILAGGAYMLAQQYVPGLAKVPALFLSQLAMIATLGVLWLLGLAVRGHDPKKDLARSPLKAQWLVGGGLALIAILVASATVLLISPISPTMPPSIAEMDKGMEELVKDTRNWYLPVALLVIAVMPAFSEELWCRAFLGRGMVGQYGPVLGVMITSYFFGAIHVLPHQGVMAMLMGLVLHYAYLTTRSLVAPMLLHFLNNGISVLGSAFGGEAEKVDTAPEHIPLALYGTAFVLLVAVALALYQSRARLVRVEGPPFLPRWQPPYPGVVLPPPGSGTIISHPWPHVALVAFVLLAFGAFATVYVLSSLGYSLP
jgi:membrane protease YdiL (CAAX protease family)